MSLHVIAQHMAAKGRGPDTQLVHMTKGEVAGLHALAQAHGTSLTTNPETGLPEAGVLSSILPTLVGAGLTFFSGGTLSPLMAGMLVGGGTAAATGSLRKGLMAGLGAWGGGGLAGGLSGIGEAAGNTAASAAADAAGQQAASQFGESAAAQGMDPAMAQTLRAQTLQDVADQTGLPGGVPNPAFDAAAKAATPGTWESLKAGASRITDPGGVQDYIQQLGGNKEAMKYGLAALAPAMLRDPAQLPGSTAPAAMHYQYNPNRVADPNAGYTGAPTGERTYFHPTYTQMAEGGSVLDAVMKRFRKPEGYVSAKEEEAQRKAAAAAQQAQQPTKTSDPGTTPQLGGMNLNAIQQRMKAAGEGFADGGQAKAPVEQNPNFTMTGMSGDAFRYLMGQGAMPHAAASAAAAAAPTTTSAVGSGGYTYDPHTHSFAPAAAAAVPAQSGAPFAYGAPPAYAWWLDAGGGGDGGGAGGSAGSASAGDANAGDGGNGTGDGGTASAAGGGLADLARGRFLRGPGDGTSDSIPATIEGQHPARLANEEYVVPARVVSEIGNGSSSAGAKRLDQMVARVQARAAKATRGRASVARDSGAYKELPA